MQGSGYLRPSKTSPKYEVFSMRQCSEAYGLIINLANAAKHHKATCHESGCNVSLSGILFAARKLQSEVWESEREEIQRLLDFGGWPF